MGAIQQYLAQVDAPANMPESRVDVTSAATASGRAMERGGEALLDVGVKALEHQKLVKEEQAKAQRTADVVNAYNSIESRANEMESVLRKQTPMGPQMVEGAVTPAPSPSEQYKTNWKMGYQQIAKEEFSKITDPLTMRALQEKLVPHTLAKYKEMLVHSDNMWSQETEAKTEQGLDYYRQQAAVVGEVGAPVDIIDTLVKRSEELIRGAGPAIHEDKKQVMIEKQRAELLKEYTRSIVENAPQEFIRRHAEGTNQSLQDRMKPGEYWGMMDRAVTILDRGHRISENAFKKKSDEISKDFRVQIIQGKSVSPQSLADASPRMTDSDLGQIDHLRHTYEDYARRDTVTDRPTFDSLRSRIIKDEIKNESDLLPYSSKLSQSDFSHLYQMTISRKDRSARDEHSPRQQLVRAGKGYISRVFGQVPGSLDFNKVAAQIESEALGLYEEQMARDTDGKIDPMENARSIVRTFIPGVQNIIQYGSPDAGFDKLLKYYSRQDTKAAFDAGKIDRATFNSQMTLFDRMEILAVELKRQSAEKAKK